MRRWGLVAFATAFSVGEVSAAETPKLHPIETYSISYTLDGTQSGTVTEHSRRNGYERAEFETTAIKAGSRTIETAKHTIAIGPEITSYDVKTRRGTRIQNPMYDKLAAAAGDDPAEMADRMMAALGGQATGETGSYAGENCSMWRIAAMNQTLCVTADGLTLMSQTSMAGVTLKRTATEIRRGDGGPEQAFIVPGDVTIVERSLPKGR